ncbi:MAG TPA: protein kinase [Thermoanaerobaculia bacterium]|nr:protein kinase [Thermoanaerobaculia bacterium]
MARGTDTRRSTSSEATRVTLARAETTLVTPAGPAAPPPKAPPARGGGLATKFFLAAAFLVVATLGVAIAVGTWRANQAAERSIRESLRDLPGAFGSYEISLEESLRRQLASVADEPGTKSLFSTRDQKTLHDWTADKAQAGKLDAGAVFLFDERGVLLDRSDQDVTEATRRSFASVKWVADALKGVPSTAVIREKTTLSYVASVPVLSGDPSVGEGRLVGVLAAAVPLDAARARTLQGLTKGQAGFLANVARRGEPPAVELSAATEGFRGDALVPALAAQPAAVDTLFEKGRPVGPLDVSVAGDRRIVGAVPLKSAAGETLGAFVVSRSREEETAAFRNIRDTLLLVGALALLVALPVSFATGRRIARPLEDLARGAAAIREGNLDVKLPEAGGGEVGALARAFSAMVGELKEKAALEQMVAGIRRDAHATRGETLAARAPAPDAAARAFAGPRVGTLFAARYEVTALLGRGGMGTVYRAVDRELDDEIALKVLLPDAFDEGSGAAQTLKQEIRLARKITHRNVVRTHDLGEAEGVRFLTMEYVPGTTLRDILDRRGAVALGPGLQIAKQLCRGLAAVHEAGIVHRDIKPPNIMVLPSGVVKLMDFGIARAAGGDDPGDGSTVGTPYYMSPEQARGEAVDERSDIYAIGIVLYEMFTGVRPIGGATPGEVMRNHLSDEPRPVTALRPDLPALLERLVAACLAKSPDRRPPSASDLADALLRLGE